MIGDDLDDPVAPPRRTRRAFKDPWAYLRELQERPFRTPCEAAWYVPNYREQIYRWLRAGRPAGRRLILVVMMPERVKREAVFVRRIVVIDETRMEVAQDGEGMTIFAGRRLRPMRKLVGVLDRR